MVRAVATAGRRSPTSEPVLDVGDESLEVAETREPFHQAPEVDRGVVVDEDVSEARETRSTASTVRSWCSAGSRSSPRSSSATFSRVTASASASTRITSASDAANRRGIYCECRADLRESDPSGALTEHLHIQRSFPVEPSSFRSMLWGTAALFPGLARSRHLPFVEESQS